MQDIDEEEAVRKEEERLKRLQQKKNQQYASAVFGGGLQGARLAGQPGAAAAPKPAAPVGGQPKVGGFAPGGLEAARAAAPAPAIKSPTHHYPAVQAPTPLGTAQPVKKPYVPPPVESTTVEEPKTLPTSIMGMNDEEMARREEERMSKRLGGAAANAPHIWNANAPKPAPVTHAAPAPVQHTQPVNPPYHAQPAQVYHAPAPVHSEPAPVATFHAQTNAAPKPYTPAPAPVQAAPKPKEAWELPPSAPQHGTKYEHMLLAEIVNARTNPHSLISRLEERKNHFHNDNEYRNLRTEVVMPTQEGIKGVDTAIQFIRQLPALGSYPRLRLEDGLSQSAQDFCSMQRGMRRAQESDDEAQSRLNKYGRFHGSVAQNIAFCNVSPEELILDWIIDDGNYSRSHRDAIFDHAAHVVGIASGPTTVGRVVCVLFAHDYTAAQAQAPASFSSPPTNTYQAPPVSTYQAPPASNYAAPAPAPVHAPTVNKYPEFQIGQLVSSSDGKSNLLHISNLGCSISDLYVATRNNGNSLEFSRKSPAGTDTRVFGLPYQVNSTSTSASYSAHTNGGELTIRLGKIVPFSAGQSGDHTICTYTVNADPSSPHQRVSVKVVQDNSEYYEFLPGPASPFSTQVEVVLSGTNLLFKSTYDVTEGGNIITKKVTQTIALPTVPGNDQIETHPAPGGLGVRIYHRPRGNQPQQAVPDTDIFISAQ